MPPREPWFRVWASEGSFTLSCGCEFEFVNPAEDDNETEDYRFFQCETHEAVNTAAINVRQWEKSPC